jgi:hypothetical protein
MKLKEASNAAAEQSLLLAKGQHAGSIVLVRLPRSLKVGYNFHLRLAELAEMQTTGRSYAIAGPPQVFSDAWHRNYLLRCHLAGVEKFLWGVVQALDQFGFLNQAQFLIPDAEDGVLRQVVGRDAPRQKGGAR